MSTTFIQEWNKGSKHVGNQRIHLGEGASLRHSVVTLGGDVVRIRMDQDLAAIKAISTCLASTLWIRASISNIAP